MTKREKARIARRLLRSELDCAIRDMALLAICIATAQNTHDDQKTYMAAAIKGFLKRVSKP